MTVSALSLRFGIVYVLGAIAVLVLMWLAEAYLGIDGNLGTGMVPVFVAALDAGQAWAKRADTVPGSAFSWKVVAVFTGVLAVITAAQLGLLFSLQPELLRDVPSRWLIAGGLIVTLIAFLACRFFFPFGAIMYVPAAVRK